MVPPNLLDLSAKAVLITDGNGGLGLGFARGLAKSGADIIIWGAAQKKCRGRKSVCTI